MVNVKINENCLRYDVTTEFKRYLAKLSSQPQGISEARLNSNELDISSSNIDDENIKRVCNCNRITCIKAKNNNINFASVSVFSNLISLDLSLNELRNLHVPPGSFSKIQKLDLSYNFLPPAALVDLANLQCLRSLFLSGNELSSIPTKLRQVIYAFSTLEELNLDDNKLHAAADIAALAQLPNLQRLSLANNEFTSFPILRVEAKLSPSKSKQLNFEEAIIPVVVCPNLKVLSLCGNPFIEEFPKAPPKIQTILVEQHGISVECERSKFWCSKYSRLGPTKLDRQRRDQLPPLTTAVKNVDGEFEEKSTVDVSEFPDSGEHPLFSQHELSIEYSELPIGPEVSPQNLFIAVYLFQTKRSGRRRRSQRAVRHSFFKSNGANGLQRPKISSLYRMLQEAIENPRDSIE
ncbi:X-ray radiation resistance-associated protein [Echinococcus granulosus]|uniref:X-ray radiation resistance-associated protein n=1 Tax=Echinococcus granulosus TaxID=6210 RepID=W6UQI7_ECHGR|nr:X-ray radiation resistance-associated protein [Echinococcus granulosus]EUB55694.1 X-ray radiation resistance-associated protein [Echinococcus granulosus]